MTPALAEISIYQPTYTLRSGSPVRARYINTESTSGDFPVTDNCERSATVMNDDYVKLSFKLIRQTVFEAFSFIYYDNQLFFLKEEYRPTSKGSYYQYEMKFVSIANMLDKHICLRYMTVDGTAVSPEPEINMNGTLPEMAEIVMTSISGAADRLNADQPNLFYYYVLKRLALSTTDLQQNTTLQTFSFSGQNIADVLTQIANTYEIEWWLTQESLTSVKLHLCRCEQGDAIVVSDQYKDTGNTLQPYESRGLLSCEYSQQWSDVPQKIIPFGSDRNITRQQALQTVNGNDMYVSYGKQLRLAPSTTYTVTDREGNEVQITTDALGAFTNTAVRSGIETVEMFDDIYPRCHFRVLGVTMRGTDNPIYTITAAAIKADGVSLMSYAEMVAAELLPLQIEPNETLSIIFESGYLNGREFEVSYDYKEVNGVMQWTLTIVPDEDGDNGVSLPFGNFVPRARVEGGYEGDMFAIFHMIMPQGYITRAQEELAQAAYEKLLAIEDTRPEIKCKTEPLFFANQTLCLGKRVAVHSELFGNIVLNAVGDITDDSPSLFVSRVTAFSHSLTKPNSVEFKLASARVEGRLAEIEAVIADRTSDIRGLEQRSLNLSRRGWHDAAEMRDMLESLAAEMMLVGVEKHQFAFTSAITCVNGYIVSGIDHFDHLHISAGYIQHTQEPYIKYANGGRWDINQTDLTADENGNALSANPTTPYYLYAKCLSGATTAQLVLSPTKHESDTDYLLMGVLSSEYEDEDAETSYRVFNRSNGYTQIAGGTITTEQIQDPTRSLIIDFQSDPPRIIARNGAKIIGNIEFSLTEDNIEQVLDRIGNIGGENLIETLGEEYTQTGTYAGLNQVFIPFRNSQQGSYPTFPAGKYVFSAEYIHIYKTGNGVPPNGIHLEIVNAASRGAVTQYWTVEQSEPVLTAFELTTASPLFLRVYWSESAEATISIKNAMLQSGSTPTAYQPYVDHLTAALKGTTEIAGGLILSNTIILRDTNNNVYSGWTGLAEDYGHIVFWSGGTFQDALNGTAKYILYDDGSAKFGGGKINIDTTTGQEMFSIVIGGLEKILIAPRPIAGNYLPQGTANFSSSQTGSSSSEQTVLEYTFNEFTTPHMKSGTSDFLIGCNVTASSSGGYEVGVRAEVKLQAFRNNTWVDVMSFGSGDSDLQYNTATVIINHSESNVTTLLSNTTYRFYCKSTQVYYQGTNTITVNSCSIVGTYTPYYVPKTVIGTDGILSAYSNDNYFYVKNDGTKQILYLKGLRSVSSSSVIANSGEVCGTDSTFTNNLAQLLSLCAQYGAAMAYGGTLSPGTYIGQNYSTFDELVAIFLSQYKFLLTK